MTAAEAFVWFDDWRWTRTGAEHRAEELRAMYPDCGVTVDKMFRWLRSYRVRVWMHH